MELTKLLYERGYDKLTILKLFKFLDWLMWLPEELQQKYDEDLARYEEEKRMSYVTNIERKGIEKGRVEGRVEGALNLALRQLQHLFGPLAVETQDRIRSLPMEDLEELGDALLTFKDAGDLQAWLEAHPGRGM